VSTSARALWLAKYWFLDDAIAVAIRSEPESRKTLDDVAAAAAEGKAGNETTATAATTLR
jgi:hypothetical protein